MVSAQAQGWSVAVEPRGLASSCNAVLPLSHRFAVSCCRNGLEVESCELTDLLRSVVAGVCPASLESQKGS